MIPIVLAFAAGAIAGIVSMLLARRRRRRAPITVVPPRSGDVLRGPWTKEGRWRP